MKGFILAASLALGAAAQAHNEARAHPHGKPLDLAQRQDDGCKSEDRVTSSRIGFCTTNSCRPITKTCDPGPTSVITPTLSTMTRIDGCTTTLAVDWFPCSTCRTCYSAPLTTPTPAPFYGEPLDVVRRAMNGGEDCKPEERETTKVPICPTFSCAQITKTCEPGPTSVIESKRTTITRVSGCTTTLSVDWVPCSTCATCTPARPSPTSGRPPVPTSSGSCTGGGRIKTEGVCPSLFCAEPTVDCSGKPTEVIKTVTTTEVVVKGCSTTLRVGQNPCPTCNTCKPSSTRVGPPCCKPTVTTTSKVVSPPCCKPPVGTTSKSASCTGKGKTITQGLCPSYKCAVPTTTCKPGRPTPETKTTTNIVVEDCTTIHQIGLSPCPTCPTCLADAPRPTHPADGKRQECAALKTVSFDKCAAVRCAAPTKVCPLGEPLRTRTTKTIATESCTVRVQAGFDPCCETCTRRHLTRPGITLPVEPTLLPSKRDSGEKCSSLVTSRFDKCSLVRCAAPTRLCAFDEAPHTRTTKTIATESCTVRVQAGFDPCCETCSRRRSNPPLPTGITLPIEPTLHASKRAECDSKEYTTVKHNKCSLVRCAAPSTECLVPEPPRTVVTKTLSTVGCTVSLSVGPEKCCQTCTGGPTAVPPSPTTRTPKPTNTPGYPPCRDTVTTTVNDLCPQVRCAPVSATCSGKLTTVTRTKRLETERVNPCTWAVHTGWSPCAFCTPCEVPTALATANVFDEEKGVWIRVEGFRPTPTPY